jgi:hypothetical protein
VASTAGRPASTSPTSCPVLPRDVPIYWKKGNVKEKGGKTKYKLKLKDKINAKGAKIKPKRVRE